MEEDNDEHLGDSSHLIVVGQRHLLTTGPVQTLVGSCSFLEISSLCLFS